MAFVCPTAEDRAEKAAGQRKELIKSLKDLISRVEEECMNPVDDCPAEPCCVPCVQTCCPPETPKPPKAASPDWMVCQN